MFLTLLIFLYYDYAMFQKKHPQNLQKSGVSVVKVVFSEAKLHPFGGHAFLEKGGLLL